MRYGCLLEAKLSKLERELKFLVPDLQVEIISYEGEVVRVKPNFSFIHISSFFPNFIQKP